MTNTYIPYNQKLWMIGRKGGLFTFFSPLAFSTDEKVGYIAQGVCTGCGLCLYPYEWMDGWRGELDHGLVFEVWVHHYNPFRAKVTFWGKGPASSVSVGGIGIGMALVLLSCLRVKFVCVCAEDEDESVMWILWIWI